MIILLVVFLLLLLLWFTAGLFAMRMALGRHAKPKSLLEECRSFYEWVGEVRPAVEAGVARIRTAEHSRRTIRSEDGLTLCADFYPVPDARGIVLAFHGYGSCGENDFCCAVGLYLDAGWSVLLVQQRACGDSEGKWMTLGIRERKDVLLWSRSMASEFPALPQVLAGVSMGATSVLTATALPLPENVHGVIADCGFESPRSVLREQARHRYGAFGTLVVAGAELWARLLLRINFGEISTVAAMHDCALPVLFLHGAADTFVPPVHTQKAYAACRSEKQLLLVPGAVHTAAIPLGGESVRSAVVDFLRKAEKAPEIR